MRKINWGIIGLGNIAHEFSKAFDQINNAKLLAISSKDENKLKKFGQQFNVESKFSFKSYQDLINCDEVDIIYIALPNSFHKEWIIKAIENNKNILVEKPATINFHEANEIKECLKKTNIFFSEAFRSPATRFKIKTSSALKSKLFTIAPASQPKDEAAS